jgi:hypothetical protein
MTKDDAREYNQFMADLLNAKFNKTHTEGQMVEKLIQLCQNGNVYALRDLEKAKLSDSSGAIMANPIYKTGAIFDMTDISSPLQTGPVGTDNFGLWREEGRRK